jgi:uncharacterized alkaline shock family protein YloU
VAGPPAAEEPVIGSISFSNAAVAKLAARAAVELPDIGAAAPRLLGRTIAGAGRMGIPGTSLAGLPRTSAEVDGGDTFVELTISVRWPAPLPQVTAALARHLRERIHGLTGLAVADVRITVAALVAEAPARRVH